MEDFRALPSFRLGVLWTLIERQMEHRHHRKFGLRSLECRVIGITAANNPLSFKRLCVDAMLDKSSASRVIAKLVEKGLLARHEDPNDQRSFYVSITEAGKKARAAILEDAKERDAGLTSALSSDELALFLEQVEGLIVNARDRLREEEGRTGTESLQNGLPAWLNDEKPTQELIPILLKPDVAESLYALLGRALSSGDKGT